MSRALDLINSLLSDLDNYSSLKLRRNNMTQKKSELNINCDKIKEFVYKSWDNSVLSTIQEYIKIPNQSPDYDKNIYKNGYQEKALRLLEKWINNNKPKNCKIDVLEEKEMTPFIFMEIDAFNTTCKDTVLMYGHFDKQPPLDDKDWIDDLGPYKPIIKDGKLYGRGGADDGYSTFAAIDSIRALQDQNASHPRIVITIEGSEESGSPHLDHYLDKLKDRIGEPSVVICLDSGCGDYSRLWLTSSLRGIVIGKLRCQLLKEGIHSGSSGLVRDSFHVLRHILDRFDDPLTGKCKITELNSKIPESHRKYAQDMGKEIDSKLWTDLPLCDGVECQLPSKRENITELLLNSSWRPQLTVTGIEGMPDLKGGNVLRKYTTLKLSIRLPPNVNPEIAVKVIKNKLEANPPFNCKLEFICDGHYGEGFCCPDFEDWLYDSLNLSSSIYYENKKCLLLGEGGSIPLMGQLQKNFPKAQFVVTGILGPNSNAHGPNEFLHIDYTKRLICCIANILNACANPTNKNTSINKREQSGQNRTDTKVLPKNYQ